MTNKRKRVRLTTPTGVARYPYLSKPDTQFVAQGEYKVDLLLDQEEHREFLERLDELADNAVEKAKQALTKQKKVAQAKQVIRHDPYTPLYDEEGEPTGQVLVKFKSKAQYTDKAGNVVKIRPALFDAKGKAVDPNKVIPYSGSIIKVNFTPREYYVSATKLAGVTLQLNAVQIIELVTGGHGGGTADSFGFEVEDGFDSTSMDFQGNEDSFNDVDDEEDEGVEEVDLEGVDF